MEYIINPGFLYTYIYKTIEKHNEYTQFSFFAVIMHFNLILFYIRLI